MSQKKSNSATIIANGQFPVNPKALNYLEDSNFIICCDGATQKLVNTGLEPDAIVGDLDSISSELNKKYKNKLFHFPDQNSNDLTKAIHWAENRGFKELNILGATGLREDHSIGNIFLLTEYSKLLKVKMITDFAEIIPINKTTTFDSFQGQQVSIFVSDRDTELSFEGLKYPVDKQKFTGLWMGTLNESLGNKFTIHINKPGVLIYKLHSST